jgi:hypothetical protein
MSVSMYFIATVFRRNELAATVKQLLNDEFLELLGVDFSIAKQKRDSQERNFILGKLAMNVTEFIANRQDVIKTTRLAASAYRCMLQLQ